MSRLHRRRTQRAQGGDGMNDPEFWTVDEIAERLRVSVMTIYRAIHAEELHALRFGRQFRVPNRALNDFLRAANTVEWERPR
jgi:excisionase family DNA binding protein